MDIYLCASIRGGRSLQPFYKKLLDFLKSLGHTVLTSHVALANVIEMEKGLTASDIFIQDTRWLKKCDIIIAEVTVPSLGVGYEIGEGLNLNKRILCIYDKQYAPISAMIQGNNHKLLSVESYTSIDEAKSLIKDFLSTFERRK